MTGWNTSSDLVDEYCIPAFDVDDTAFLEPSPISPVKYDYVDFPHSLKGLGVDCCGCGSNKISDDYTTFSFVRPSPWQTLTIQGGASKITTCRPCYGAVNTIQPFEWPPQGSGSFVDPAECLIGEDSKPTEEITADLSAPCSLAISSSTPLYPTTHSSFSSQMQDDTVCPVLTLEDSGSMSGTLDDSSPSTACTDTTDFFTWDMQEPRQSAVSTPRAGISRSNQDDLDTTVVPRKGVRKSTAHRANSKRNAQLERNRAANRAAALKYRKKQKGAMDRLEARLKVLGRERVAIQGTIGTLGAVLGCLKKEVSRHLGCDDEKILRHLHHEGSTEEEAGTTQEQT